MIKKYLLAALLSVCFIKVSAQDFKLVSDNGNEVILNRVPGIEFMTDGTTLVDGIRYKKFTPGAVFTMEKGAPALPVERTSIQVAGTGNVVLEVSYSGFITYQGVNILPSKGSLTRNINPKDIPYEFGPAYTQDGFYPGKLAEAGSTYTFRDTYGVTISVYPYQYNPVTKTLKVYNHITVKVVTDGGTNHKSGLTPANSTFAKLYSNHYLNAKTTTFSTDDVPAAEMLIIAPDGYAQTLAPLAGWKIESGLKTTIVPMSQAGTTPQNIKSYIQQYYTQNPGLTYVLLAGDHQNLPSYSYGISGGGEELWSDTYYAQLEGDDFYPEVLVGRMSGTVADVATMVNRTLEYETAPLAGNWMTRIAGIGSNEGDGYGDDGEPDWQHLRNIGSQLLQHGYTYAYEFFDGSHGGNDQDDSPSNVMISDAVNSGVGLVNYTGHGGSNEFSTGAYTNTHVAGLTNAGMYPFVVSVACNNGTFTTGTSICESWLTTKNNGAPTGAIAACGSSILMAWAEPMQTQDAMTDLIVGTTTHSLGNLFYGGQLSMLEAYGQSPTAIEIMQTWVFFGDPSVVYRNQPSQPLLVTHASEINPSADSITVNCTTNGAVIAITQNGVVVGTAVVVNGVAVVTLGSFNPALPLVVTATMQNHTPYQGTVTTNVLGSAAFNAGAIRLYPNPAGAQLTISHTVNNSGASYSVHDITGKLILKSGLPAGNSFTVDTSLYASGVYLLTIQSEGTAHTQKFIKQ
jgi:gingipain R